MKNKLTILLMLSALSIFFYACSDDSTNNPDNNDNPSDYYKLSIGNWWYYQTDILDTLGNAMEGSTSFDTSKVDGQLQYKGKNALRMVDIYTLDSNQTYQDTTFMAVEGPQFYVYMDYLGNSQFALPYGEWVLMADFNQNEWTVLDSIVDGIQITIMNGITGTLDSTNIKITGKKLGKENITVKGQTVEAQKFEQTLTINGQVDMGGGFKISINKDLSTTFYFAKNIGLAKVYQPPLIFTVPGFGNQQVVGSNMILLDYKIQ